MPSRAVLSRFVALAAGKISAPVVLVCRKDAANLEIICTSMEAIGAHETAVLPLNQSICQHVIEMERPLAVEDAFAHPLLKSIPHTALSSVGAYLGVPVCLGTSEVVGTLCAIYPHSHRWSDDDVAELTAIAKGMDADLRNLRV